MVDQFAKIQRLESYDSSSFRLLKRSTVNPWILRNFKMSSNVPTAIAIVLAACPQLSPG